MSVKQTDKIDFIGKSTDSKEVSLAISDHLDLKTEKKHIEILQNKINSYISFIESGQINEHLNDKKKKVKVIIYFKYEPTDFANEFLSEVHKVLKTISVELEYKTLKDGESDPT